MFYFVHELNLNDYMKIILRIIGILLGMLVAFLVFAAITPKQFKVNESVVIDAPKAEVFNYVRSLKNLSSQTVWQQIDPNVKKTFRGVDGQVGSVYRWESDHKKVGVGEQEITAIDENKQIDYALRFEKPWEMNDKTSMTFIEKDGKTTLIWDYTSAKIPYPFNAMAIPFNQPTLKKQFLQGLENIKATVEKN